MRSASTVTVQEPPFQLRGSTFTMMVLKVIAPEDPSFQSLIVSKIRQAPNFFRNAPVVLDLDELQASPEFDLIDFVVRLREINLIAVGIHGGTPELQRLAIEAGLPVMPAGRSAPRQDGPAEAAGPAVENGTSNRFGLAPGRAPTDPMPPKAQPRAEAPEPAPATAPAPQDRSRATMVVSEPVRSGRQIYAPGGDLIVLGPVSPGAELLADGNIHVYGPLRGRALAGLSGEPSARIFCQSLEAELVSIAGLYRINEDIDQQVLRKPVQIWLDDGYLRIDPL